MSPNLTEWHTYLEVSNWNAEKKELPPDLTNTTLRWDDPLSSTAVQIAEICCQFNLVN